MEVLYSEKSLIIQPYKFHSNQVSYLDLCHRHTINTLGNHVSCMYLCSFVFVHLMDYFGGKQERRRWGRCYKALSFFLLSTSPIGESTCLISSWFWVRVPGGQLTFKPVMTDVNFSSLPPLIVPSHHDR